MATRPFSLMDLEYFVAVYDHGSFARASERLHKARSNVSDQIALLESRLDVTLLVRSHIGVRPTRQGEAFYRYATRVLQMADEAEESVKGDSAA